MFVSGRIGLLGREGGFGNGYGFMVWSGMRAFFYSLVSLLIASRRSGYLVTGDVDDVFPVLFRYRHPQI